MSDAIALTNQPLMPIGLVQRAREYVAASRAKNTLRAYRVAWREFEVFCQTHGVSTLPASRDTLVAYLTHLADSGLRVSSIEVKLAGIVAAHESQGYASPAKHPDVKMLMAGIRRTLGTARQQKAAIVRSDLEQLIGAMPADLRGMRDQAILLLGWAGAFRRSELVALDVEDLHFTDDDVTVIVRHSKTDQEARGMKKRIPLLEHPELCPVRALREWLKAAHIESGSLFRAIDRWGHVRKDRLTDRVVALIVKEAAERAGMDTAQFAGHSLRAGFVTQSAKDGVAEWAISEVTGHKSPAVLRQYIRDAGVGQVQAIRRAFGETPHAE